MKQSKNYPRLLTNVLQAVADLKEPNGSSVKNIMAQVQTAINISNIRPKPRNVVMQVRRAIRHGIESGVLKQRAGKVFLTIGTRHSNTNTKSNSKSKSTNRRSQRLKKKNVLGSQSSSCSINEPFRKSLKSVRKKKVEEPVDKSRRKKHKRSRKGKKHHRRAKETIPEDTGETNNNEEKETRKRTPSKEKEENNEEDGAKDLNNEEQNHVSCDNPDCLCNLKQEPNDFDDNDNYNNDYV